MNRLYGNMVYLAGPIDCAPDFGVGWRQHVQESLKGLNLIWLDPCHKPMIEGYACEDLENHIRRRDLKEAGDYVTLAKMMRTIRCIDLRLVDKCDFAIVHLDKNIYTTGTSEEITTLNRRKVAILIHMEQGREQLPDWWYGTIRPEHVFSTWDDLFNYVRHVASDPNPETFGRWQFIDYKTLFKQLDPA